MAKDKDIIKKEIELFKVENEGEYGEYYIGITNDVHRRIDEAVENELVEHKREGRYDDNSPKYSEECISRDEAVEIERYFQEKGMKGFNPRSVGVLTSKFIYCFKLKKRKFKNFDEFIAS